MSETEADRPTKDSFPITMEVLRAGEAAFREWDPDTEDVVILVAMIIDAARKANRTTHPESPSPDR